jgi:outer membrane protein TolC
MTVQYTQHDAVALITLDDGKANALSPDVIAALGEILTKAETVLKGAEARYTAGDISLADILPVRRDWAAVQLSYLESLREVMLAWATLSLYVGRQ